MPTVSFDHVSVAYDQRPILTDISLELSERRIGIIGENGSGKSTLLRLINGLISPTSGTVRVNGLNVRTHGKKVRLNVGFIFSDVDNQIVMPTVAEDIAFSLRRLTLSREEKNRRVSAALERFNLREFANQSPHLLSGGQKQLLALAAITVLEPQIILADEPTTLLDMRNRATIQQVFATLAQQLIVVTHDLDLLADFDRVLCLHHHAVVADGSPREAIGYYKSLMEQESDFPTVQNPLHSEHHS